MMNSAIPVIGFILCASLLNMSCAPQKTARKYSGDTASAIIFIPGYKGSRLIESGSGRCAWLCISDVLFGRKTLTLNDYNLNLPASQSLVEDGVLESVTVIPGLYSIDIYGSFRRALESAFAEKAVVVALPYDWRQDNFKAVRALDLLIRQLHEQGINRISIVAHSMGGLIAAYYLRYGTLDYNVAHETWDGARYINRAVIVGVPFRGAMNAFRDMQYGVSTGWNKTLLSNIALSSFPSTYQLMPAPENRVIHTSAKLVPAKIIFNAKNWERYGWGLFNDSDSLTYTELRARALATNDYLSRAHQFFRLIHEKAHTSSIPLPVLNIIGKGHPTLSKAVFIPQRSFLPLFESYHLDGTSISATSLFDDGDGVVTRFSATLPSAYRSVLDHQSRSYNYEHSALTQQTEVQKTITDFLLEGITGN